MKRHIRTIARLALLTGIFTGASFSFAAHAETPSASNFKINDSVLFQPGNPKMKALMSYRAKKYEEAYRWFELAARQQKDPFSMFYLGIMHVQGEGVERSTTDAKKWYRLSCDNGFEMGCTALENLDKVRF